MGVGDNIGAGGQHWEGDKTTDKGRGQWGEGGQKGTDTYGPGCLYRTTTGCLPQKGLRTTATRSSSQFNIFEGTIVSDD